MAYDEHLANRVRELIAAEPDISEQRMFGGLAFLVADNMSVAVSAMRGWVRVDSEGLRTKRQLEPWVKRGVSYARSLPAKG